jgi:uncharacterized membrane protein YbhN (UPF0104 family)
VKRIPKTLLSMVRAAIAIVLLVYLAASGAIDLAVMPALASTWWLVPIGIALLFTATVATALRLCILLRPRRLYLSLWSSIQLTMIGLFFNTYLPGGTGGDLARIYYATSGNSGRGTELTTVILLDHLVGLFALVILPVLIVLILPGLAGVRVLRDLTLIAVIFAAIILTALLVSFTPQLRDNRFLTMAFRKLPLGKYAERALGVVHDYRHNLGTLLAAVGLSLVSDALTVIVMLMIAQVANPSGFVASMIILIPLGLVANAVPVTPGGLGVGEAAFARLFAAADLRGGAEVLLGWRVLMILVGLSGLVFYLRGRKRFIHESVSLQSIHVDIPQGQGM